MTGLAFVFGAILLSGAATGLAANDGFVQVRGTHFVLNGRRIYVSGTNSYYQMIHRRTGDPGADEVLDELATRSMTVVRTWAFQDMGERTYDCLQCAPAQKLANGQRPVDFISEPTLVALDQTLAAADARGVRVILTLVNNWDDFGGMNRYTLWRFGTTNHDQFYTDATIRQWFKDLIALLTSRVNTVNGRRYRDDPTLFAWQLTNEARASSPTTAAQLDAWFAEMSAYIKSLDSNHMVTTGIEGFYQGANSGLNSDSWMSAYREDFRVNHQHATIDYATCHVWPQNWGWNPITSTGAAVTKATQFVQRRVSDAETVLNKPVMVDEFGVPRDNFGRGVNSGTTVVRERFYRDVFYSLCETSARTNGAFAGTANWINLDEPTASWDDGNGIFLPSDAAMDSILTAHAQWLARLPNPDLNLDGNVDSTDLALFEACRTGSRAGSPSVGCEEADLDRDGDVDQADFGILQRCYNETGTAIDLGCALQ